MVIFMKWLIGFFDQQMLCTSSEPLISLDLGYHTNVSFSGLGPFFCYLFYCFLNQSCEPFYDVHIASLSSYTSPLH